MLSTTSPVTVQMLEPADEAAGDVDELQPAASAIAAAATTHRLRLLKSNPWVVFMVELLCMDNYLDDAGGRCAVPVDGL